MDNTLQDFLHRPAVCAALGVSESSLIRLERNGQGPQHTRIGRRVLYSKRALAQWLAKREQSTKKEASHAHAI